MSRLYTDIRDINICSSKIAISVVLISVWGIIQLSIMGIAFYNNSVAFVQDLSDGGYHINATGVKDDMNNQFNVRAKNCGTATALYLLTFTLAVHQVWVNSNRGIRVDTHGMPVETGEF